MLKEELMIGDWVLHDGEPYQIRQLGIYGVNRDGEDYPAVCVGKPKGIGLIIERNEIEPIPLTSEILEKNGFKKGKTQYYQDFYEFWSEDLDRCIYLYVYEEYFLLFDNSNADIKYVHELQHALRLCCINKEIEV